MQEVIQTLKKQLYGLADFLCCVIKQFEKDACLTTSTALAYTSLFNADINHRLLCVSGFPEFEQLGPKVESLLEQFVPEAAEDIRQVGQSYAAG